MKRQERLLALQTSLLEHIQTRISNITGQTSKGIVDYEQSFRKSLPNKIKECNAQKLKDKISSSQIIFMGDFHSLPISQRHLIDIANYVLHKSKQAFLICLECFAFEDQVYLDAYLDGRFSERELFEKTNFCKSWGFPWGPQRKILKFCKENEIPIVGLNTKDNKSLPLYERDRIFADNISRAMQKFPGRKLLCLVGELHLSSNHLPKVLLDSRPKNVVIEKTMCILSNTDKYFNRLLKKENINYAACLELNSNYFCLLDTPPWGKWLSYLLWQEHVLLHPKCETCIRPWSRQNEELCSYDVEDYFFECVNNFLKYFGIQEHYPHISSLFNRIVTLDSRIESWPIKKNKWSFYQFKEMDSFLNYDSKVVYIKPLSWRGLVSAVAQCLCSVSHISLRNSRNNVEYFSNLKTSLVCHSFESVFNPVGYLDPNWIRCNLLDEQFKLDEIEKKKDASIQSIEAFYHSFHLGRAFSCILNNHFYRSKDSFIFLHKLLLENKIIGPPFVCKVNALVTERNLTSYF